MFLDEVRKQSAPDPPPRRAASDQCIQERCFANEKIEVHWNRIPTEIVGEDGKLLRFA